MVHRFHVSHRPREKEMDLDHHEPSLRSTRPCLTVHREPRSWTRAQKEPSATTWMASPRDTCPGRSGPNLALIRPIQTHSGPIPVDH